MSGLPGLFELVPLVASEPNALQWFQSHNLIPSQLPCPQCKKPMRLDSRRCTSLRCYSRGKRHSITEGTMWFGMRINLSSAAMLIYFFCGDVQPFYVYHKFLRQNGTPAICRQTVYAWYDRFRKVCQKAMENNVIKFTNRVYLISEEFQLEIEDEESDWRVPTERVEIDEMFPGKKFKAHRGTGKRSPTLFGIVEGGGKRCVFYIVQRRDRATLIPLIQKHVSTSCDIHHDDWRAYSNLEDYGFQHHTVVHSRELKAADGTHTNTIEGLWGLLRQRITKMHGIYEIRFPLILAEFCYRRNYEDKEGNIWDSFLIHMRNN